MTQKTFIQTTPGSRRFENANFWSPTGTPGAGDDAILPSGVTNYAAIATRDDTVNSVAVAHGVVLQVGQTGSLSNFTASAGSGVGAIEGMVDIVFGAFKFGGTLLNDGEIAGQSFGLYFEGAATLAGSGEVVATHIYSAVGSGVLTNAGNTVAQSGIGGSGLYGFHKNFTLNNEANGVLLNDTITGAGGGFTPQIVVNSGLIEAVNGVAVIKRATIRGQGDGVVLAADGGSVQLDHAMIVGGTLQTSGSGVILSTYGRLVGSAGAVHNQGTVRVLDNNKLYIDAYIDNTGVIDLESTGKATILRIAQNYPDQNTAEISGAGQVVLGANPNNQISGVRYHLSGGLQRVSTLVNASTIVGTGGIGRDLSLVNSGVIDATGAGATTAAPAHALIVATGDTLVAGSNIVANSGTLESTNPSAFATTGGLILNGITVVDDPSLGMILANGANTHVDLKSATLMGGHLRTAAGGVIDTLDAGSMLNGVAHTVYNQGALVIGDNTALTVQGAISNSGTISLAAGANAARLILGLNTVLNGAGNLTLGDNPLNAIVDGPSGSKGTAAILTNVNDTIAGAGTISAILVNQAAGVIRADGANALIIDTGANVITNNGLLRSTGTGGMTIASAVTGSGRVTIKSGTINFEASFSQDMTFAGTTGVLELAQSQGYAATIAGFSQTGGTALDLGDIAFGAATKASYSGTTASGVLTVTDGTHTAHITLAGDYTTAAFVAASDGHGGTKVVDPSPPAGTANARFVSASAAFGARPMGAAVSHRWTGEPHRAVLARPRPA